MQTHSRLATEPLPRPHPPWPPLSVPPGCTAAVARSPWWRSWHPGPSWLWSGRRVCTATTTPLFFPCSPWPSRVRGQGSLGMGGAPPQNPGGLASRTFSFFAVVGGGMGAEGRFRKLLGSPPSHALGSSLLSSVSLHVPTFYLPLLPSLAWPSPSFSLLPYSCLSGLSPSWTRVSSPGSSPDPLPSAPA